MCMYVLGAAFVSLALFVNVCLCISVHISSLSLSISYVCVCHILVTDRKSQSPHITMRQNKKTAVYAN